MSDLAIVLGGSGFLGSHVADALSAAGYKVRIVDIQSSPWKRPDQEMTLCDMTDKKSLIEACKGAKYIYNLAGLADINEASQQPELTVKLNIMGNLNALEAARTVGCERFIFASTVYVYSESGSFYRVSKQACEGYIQLYASQYSVPYTILRYGSLYGPRADHRNNIFRLIDDALKNKVIRYTGSGEELREYIHVADAATASVEVLKPEFKNQHISLTGPQLMRVKDVMSMIAEMLESKPKLQFENKELESHYSITPYAYRPKVGKKLLVNPFVDLGQGILECIREQDHAQG